MKLKILIGIPASGKSTWAKNFVSENPGWCIVSRDDFRYGWQNKGFLVPKLEEVITQLIDTSIETLLSKQFNIIVDATNVKKEYLDSFISKYRSKADIEFKVFDVPVNVAIERDVVRQRSVGVEVIKKMYENYINLAETFDFQPIPQTKAKYIIPHSDPNKLPCIIVDIDGTLAHMSGKRSPYDYTKVLVDDVDVTIRNIVNRYNTTHTIIVCSGREDVCREDTIKWLDHNGIKWNLLLMRAAGDQRKDSIIKEELFWNWIQPSYNVDFVLDDRDQVVNMWRSLGLKCLQVEPGNF